MDSKQDEDIVAYNKRIEAEMNKRIHDQTNSRAFTLAFGRVMEVHLKRVSVHKRLAARWLNRLNLANKDELSAISSKLVDYEEKIDLMDDTIYLMIKMQKNNQLQLMRVRESWQKWCTFLNQEVMEIRTNKIKTLEQELCELKQLFINDMEE